MNQKKPGKKHVITAGLVAGLVAGAGAGFVMEMSGSAGASNVVASGSSRTTDTTVAPSSDGSSTTPTPSADPSTDREAAIRAALAPLMTDGTLNQAQVDKIVTALASADIGRGHGGPGMGGMGHGRIDVDTVATTIGVSTSDLQTALQGGQSIADVAKAHNVDPQKVIDALVALEKSELDAKVKAGTITQAEADTHLADETTEITDHVNQAGGFGPGRGGMGHGKGGRGMPGMGTPTDQGGTDTPATTAPSTTTG